MRMVSHYKKTNDLDGPGKEKEKEAAESKVGVGSDETCRCKEASGMRPRQLFRLMIDDLAFWKKAKKGQSRNRKEE